MDKEQIKRELVDISNKILEKYAEMDVVETISVMNMAAKTIFLGSLKVYNYEVIPNVMRDLEKELKGYGDLVVRDQKVTPCCSPSYTHISFNIIRLSFEFLREIIKISCYNFVKITLLICFIKEP